MAAQRPSAHCDAGVAEASFIPPSSNGYNDPPQLSSAVDAAVQREREQRLMSARKKLKNYRLKQAAMSTSNASASHIRRPSSSSALAHSKQGTHGRAHSRQHSRHHSRQHSRTQSRSSLAAALTDPRDGASMEEAVASQRRSSLRLARDDPATNQQDRRISASAATNSMTSQRSGGTVLHARKESKHRRRSSVATRRDSVEIMGGLGVALNPATPPLHSSLSQFQSPPSPTRARPPHDGDAHAAQRLAALSALEGRVRAPSREIALPVFAEDGDGLLPGKTGGKKIPGTLGLPPRSPSAQFAADASPQFAALSDFGNDGQLPLATGEVTARDKREKRASWGLGLAASGRNSLASTAAIGAQWGGNGGMGTIRDLGSVLEEDENEEEGENSNGEDFLSGQRPMETVAEEDEDGSFNRSTGPSPALEDSGIRLSPAAGAETSANRRRPASLLFKSVPPQPAEEGEVLTPPRVSRIMGSPDLGRPLRTLSLSSRGSRTSVTGLRTLTLTSPGASGAPSATVVQAAQALASPSRERRRNSLFSGPLSGTSPSTKPREGSVCGTSSLGSSKPRSSISYSKSSTETPAIDPSQLLEGSSHTPRTPQRNLSGRVSNSSTANAILRNPTLKDAAQEEDRLNNQSSMALLGRLADAEAERDMLRDDVEGWRLRVTDLEKALQLERIKVEDERREVLAGRERIRKLGDRLAAASSSAGTPAGQDAETRALAVAQAKLIGEMRDQIFALAAALERERAEHTVTKSALDDIMVDIPASPPQLEERFAQETAGLPELEGDKGPGKRHQGSDTSAFSSGTSFGSHCGGNTTADTSVSDDESLLQKPLSYATNPLVGVARPKENGSVRVALDTLAEEDEEEADDNRIGLQSAEVTGSTIKPDTRRTRVNSVSTQSAASDMFPKTPTCPEPLELSQKATHQRSESFIRQWSFPRGPVTTVRDAQEEHNFFFRPNSMEISLPALEPGHDALETPPFLLSYLHHEEPAITDHLPDAVTVSAVHRPRPSSPRPARRPGSGPHKRLSSGAPPPARSARVSAALSSASSNATSPALATLDPRRLSLQHLSNWVGSYVGAGPPAAATKMLACGHEDDVGSVADLTAFINDGPHPLAQKRFVQASDQPMPIAGPLNKLDFTKGWLGVFTV